MKKTLYILSVFSALSFLFSFPSSALAQYGYGGGPTYSISVNKMVGKPINTKGQTTVEYVDNLSSSDPRFQAGQDIMFQVKVKNTSTTSLSNVTIRDFIPTFIEPVEGPGTFDSSNRTITFNAGDFGANEEKIYFFKMRVLSQGSLPADKGLFCVVNRVQAYNDQTAADDTAQLCIEKQVKGGVVVTPQAGPEMGLLLISGELVLLGVGIFLKKRIS